MQAVIMSGEVSLMKTTVNIAVSARSRKERRTVSKEEVLADLVNELLMSGEVNGIEFCKLVDKSHI